jgi:hypothetical protein
MSGGNFWRRLVCGRERSKGCGECWDLRALGDGDCSRSRLLRALAARPSAKRSASEGMEAAGWALEAGR